LGWASQTQNRLSRWLHSLWMANDFTLTHAPEKPAFILINPFSLHLQHLAVIRNHHQNDRH
jgi:hypothetical protein